MKGLARPMGKRPAETIVALIDVMFFLLVFAMLVGRMDATAPFEVTPPMAGQGDDLPGGGAIVAISPDRDFALDGTVMPRDQVLDALVGRLEDKRDLRIRVTAHAELPLRHVLPLIDELSDRGAMDVVLVVEKDG